ncbi:HAMP domain-containing protein [Hansschlegelia zhihuaiae]|uniref:HAMP domain-containing protein n=2 Tax=Hansschlegelia zhihuaiae TaxID=405005 RepID=A0A4V1KJ93_9HYPH|nr:HAMP domain-containing protein [Hansschlegelia zhihuaiae]
MFGLSLRAALTALSGLSLALAIGLGIIALKSLDAVNDGAQTLYADVLSRVSSANAMSVAFSNLRISEAEHVASQDIGAKNAAKGSIVAAKAAFRGSLETYRAAAGADEEQAAIADDIAAAFDKYETLDETFVEYSSTYREIDASQIFSSEMKGPYMAISDRLRDLVATSAKAADAAHASNLATFETSWRLVAGFMICALIVSAASAAFALFGVSRPLGGLRDAMARIAGGDLEAEIPFTGQRHEIGAMANAVEVFKAGLVHGRAIERESAEARAGLEAQRKAATREMAGRFEGAIGGIVTTVSAASTELQATARAMTEAAGRTASQSIHVASAAEEAASNVGQAADATERLGHTVREIGRQVADSARLAEATVSDARRTGRLVQELNDAASRIGDVLDMISTIAAQTNLLALNATIEAARAGEAGKGFAVVASEVKTLAAQTATATDEIARQIAAIQASTVDAVSAIGAIGARISEMSDTTGAIAAAVERQEAATVEIIAKVTQAAGGAGDVTTNITGVAAAADHTGAAAGQVLEAASELSRQSEHLSSEVERFLSTVRAA